MNDRHLLVLGWIATATAAVMYLSYIDQIGLNLSGHKGSILQPAATILNCTLWSAYGYLRPKRDWPIVAANSPGILFGLLALITAL